MTTNESELEPTRNIPANSNISRWIPVGMFEIGAISMQSFAISFKMWGFDFIYIFTQRVYRYLFPPPKKPRIRVLDPREIIVDLKKYS